MKQNDSGHRMPPHRHVHEDTSAEDVLHTGNPARVSETSIEGLEYIIKALKAGKSFREMQVEWRTAHGK